MVGLLVGSRSHASAAGTLGGLEDSLLSTVHMPSGVPVATVALNGAANTAFLAPQILGLSDEDLARKLEGAKA